MFHLCRMLWVQQVIRTGWIQNYKHHHLLLSLGYNRKKKNNFFVIPSFIPKIHLCITKDIKLWVFHLSYPSQSKGKKISKVITTQKIRRSSCIEKWSGFKEPNRISYYVKKSCFEWKLIMVFMIIWKYFFLVMANGRWTLDVSSDVKIFSDVKHNFIWTTNMFWCFC